MTIEDPKDPQKEMRDAKRIIYATLVFVIAIIVLGNWIR